MTEDTSWLQVKVAAQAKRIQHLEKVQDASKEGRLASQYVHAQAQLARVNSTYAYRDSSYVKGYETGFFAGLRTARTNLIEIEDLLP